jgi:hypothetical protein
MTLAYKVRGSASQYEMRSINYGFFFGYKCISVSFVLLVKATEVCMWIENFRLEGDQFVKF